MNLTLNIYDNAGKEVVKTCKSTTYDLMFGTVMQLMGLLKIEETQNPLELIKIISGAWGEITTVLTEVFPDVTAEDWKHVKVKELLPLIVSIAKYAVNDMFNIPTDEKN